MTVYRSEVMKEIDWEERHFQICLALIQGQATKPATPSFPYTTIIKQADRMVELLKKHVETTNPFKEDVTISTRVSTPEESSEGAKKSKYIFHKQSVYGLKIWHALEQLGYSKGSDIPYFHFNECCEELNIEINKIDIEQFEDRFDVHIG